VRAGLQTASGDLILVTDVDMSSPLDETAKLVAVLDDGFDLVIGSHAVAGAELSARQHPLRELLGKTGNSLLRLLTGLPYRDTQCGFKLIRADVARRLAEHQRIEGYLYDAELCLIAAQLGFRVAEVPVRWSHDPDSRVRLLRSAPGVALDLLRLRRLARHPLERSAERTPAPSVGARG
jgi:dolichyl-phosphate beta-glucosyltransferase